MFSPGMIWLRNDIDIYNEIHNDFLQFPQDKHPQLTQEGCEFKPWFMYVSVIEVLYAIACITC